MNEVFAYAKKWVFEAGFPIVPVVYHSKRAMIEWEYYQDHLPTENDLLSWFYSPLRNLGVVVGNGLVVIDFDVQEVFDYWHHTEFLPKHPEGTYMVKTRRGVHVYVKTSEPARNSHNSLLDVKAERGYVLAPPSIHPSGYQYSVLSNRPILSIERLSDVLPAVYTPEPENAYNTEYQNDMPVYYDDPFDEADNAQNFDLRAIKTKFSILDLLKGVRKSDRSGRWFIAYCPFHDDKNPSFWIDMKNGICGCHKCNIKPMDVVNLFARLNNISNQEAIKRLGNVV